MISFLRTLKPDMVWFDNFSPTTLAHLDKAVQDRVEEFRRAKLGMRNILLKGKLPFIQETQHPELQKIMRFSPKLLDQATAFWEYKPIVAIDGASSDPSITGNIITESFSAVAFSPSSSLDYNSKHRIRYRNSNPPSDFDDISAVSDWYNSLSCNEESIEQDGFLRHLENILINESQKNDKILAHGLPFTYLFFRDLEHAESEQRFAHLRKILLSDKAMFLASSGIEKYRGIANCLRGGEFILISDMREHLVENIISSSQLNSYQKKLVRTLIDEFGDNWVLGGYRASDHGSSNVFLCHVDAFKESAALLYVDTLKSGSRSFSLSLDIADRRANSVLDHAVAKNRVQNSFYKYGGSEFALERSTRAKWN